jgi:hypothetical protein
VAAPDENNPDYAGSVPCGGPASVILPSCGQGWKKPGFFYKNPVQWVFFCFLWVFLYICPEERVFRVFSVSRILLGASRL